MFPKSTGTSVDSGREFAELIRKEYTKESRVLNKAVPRFPLGKMRE